MPLPILLIAPEISAEPVASALRRSLDAHVDTTLNRRTAVALLRRRDYELVVLEDSLLAVDPQASEHLDRFTGAATLLEVNFVLANAERIVRQVRSALTRRTQEHLRAELAATASLQSELNRTLTGLLLESELALREVPIAQQSKLRSVVQLASTLRDRLRTA